MQIDQQPAIIADTMPERPMGQALWRGFRTRCPNCGEGRLLHHYLKVHDTCPECGEELFHHRADDGPAYLSILIVGHIMAPLLLLTFKTFRPEPLVLFAIFAVGSMALAFYLLPRLKGIVIAFQWARRMGGFDRPA